VRTTIVFETYWRFAAERHAAYLRRLRGEPAPWSQDPILLAHRFTNAFRAADRVSQYLIANVQYGQHRSQAPDEVFFRTLLFKLFNKVTTWKLLEERLGPLSWQSTDLAAVQKVLSNAFARGTRLYSAAYIMPAPGFGAPRKHSNHLALLNQMMRDGAPGKIASAKSLSDVFELLLSYPGVGPFLAFQYTIDLNYSSILPFDEDAFVVAGPGALDGISKCFEDTGGRSPEEMIHWMTDNQEREFLHRGIAFPGLFGRRLQPIDCQNLFCEISKYARVAHPAVLGVSNRTRIKQRYKASCEPLARPCFPPKWGLSVPLAAAPRPASLFE